MNRGANTFDDLDAYMATLSEEERQGVEEAEAALDLAQILYHARKARGLTQRAAAIRSGLKQQAISRWERSHPNVQLDTLRQYLDALGYSLDLVIRDSQTGEVLTTLGLPAQATQSQKFQPTVAPRSTSIQALFASPPLQRTNVGGVTGGATDLLSSYRLALDYVTSALDVVGPAGNYLQTRDWTDRESTDGGPVTTSQSNRARPVIQRREMAPSA